MFFSSSKREKARSSGASMESNQSKKGGKPRLERRNAVKNVDYEADGPESVSRRATWSARSPSGSEDTESLRTARSLDVSPSAYSNQTSFRIDGSIEGEVEMLCRSLGLTSPDDFAISVTDWENRRTSSKDSELASVSGEELGESRADDMDKAQETSCSVQVEKQFGGGDDQWVLRTTGAGNGGIRGIRPPVLAPPSPAAFYSSGVLESSVENSITELKLPPGSMARPAKDISSSSWDIIKSFGPDDADTLSRVTREVVNCKEEEEQEEEEIVIPDASVREEELRELKWGHTPEDFTGTSSFSTMNDDETSSTTTETTISPNIRLRKRIKSWSPGVLLGSGSYGRVFEAISEDGEFFAVKEVSLLDQGSKGQQCINQLEQEIALLSQFEHENIVQYYGTEKVEGKLYIFLELISQGSLVSLYQKYTLRDSQVSAYTRQILKGLNYLHEKNVVHRDIKCANILVHANGSVKLADFGLAKEISKINVLKSCKGSVYWMAPEVVNPKKTYGPSADIWSLGCTVLEMLTRDIPFPNVEWTVAFYMIGKGQQPPIPDNLSKDARDFISQCLKAVPEDRPTAAELLEHPFIKRSPPSSRSEFSSPNNDRWR